MHFKELTMVLTAKCGDHYAKVGGTVELAAGEGLTEAKENLFTEIRTNLSELVAIANGTKASLPTIVKAAAKAKVAAVEEASSSEEEVVEEEETPPVPVAKPPKKGTDEKKSERPAKAGKVAKSTAVIFDREIKEHRTQLGPILKEELGANYKEDEALKPKGPYVSQKLTEAKAEFMDADGNILDSFKARVIALLEQYDDENDEA